MTDTITMVMAGGKGSRLAPLTSHRAKPAVPFAGRYRIIDFVLSNLVNSGYRRIFVLTQYMASSLIQHLSRNWHLTGSEFIEVSPAQMRLGEHWYRGTADSVLQNLNLVRDFRPQQVAVFGGDHIYKFDVSQMEAEHLDHAADLTVAAYAVPTSEAHGFGVLVVDDRGRIVDFQEKPASPASIPGRPGVSLVSMGNYLFRTEALVAAVTGELRRPDSTLDFGRDVIPRLVREGAVVYTYDFGSNRLPGAAEPTKPYWRDVGTIDSYFQANSDVRSRLPTLDLYNRSWRIRSAQRDFPPARFVLEAGDASTQLLDCLVTEGSIIANSSLRGVLVGYDCYVHTGAEIEDTILVSGTSIGAGARVRNLLADKNCEVAPGTEIGLDPEADRARFPFVTAEGLVVLPKGTRVPRHGRIELPGDMANVLLNDPATKDTMVSFEGNYTVDDSGRHSSESLGPQLRR